MQSFKKTRHLAYRIIDSKAYVVNTKDSVLHEMNETGTFIWKMLEPPGSTLREMVKKITDEFDITAKKAEKDVKDFLSMLTKHGLIEKIK